MLILWLFGVSRSAPTPFVKLLRQWLASDNDGRQDNNTTLITRENKLNNLLWGQNSKG